MTTKEFSTRLEKQQLVLTPEQLEQFAKYANLLVEWNEKMNLTAITNLEDIYEKHFYDCLLVSKYIQPQGSLCDVGSGAGFPGIVLKIAHPSLSLTIIEPLGKRCVFLQELVNQLGLQDVTILNERAEDVAIKFTTRYDVVTARAVANLRILAELCVPLVKKNGCFLAMKGKNGYVEAQEATHAMNVLGATLQEETCVQLSDGADRINLLYCKTNNTPKGYPRPFAKIKKQPL